MTLQNHAIGGDKIQERYHGIPHPIRQDWLSGMSYADIARKYSIDPRTAKRYAQENLPLSNLGNRPFSSILDPYHMLIDQWLQQEKVFSTTVLARLHGLGVRCGYTVVNDYVRKRRQECLTICHKYTFSQFQDAENLTVERSAV